MASESQVADAIGTAPRARSDVIDLERTICLATVSTPILVLEQQVGPHFPSSKLPLLVLDALDLRVLKQLGVEAHPLDLDAPHSDPSPTPPRPRDDVAP